ncbi:unnamed protein product [Prorocentrum cordatum]|uniref:Uncharacterized protein n=1 Tax=Prorocentrum cordatum TaxID=2364126 RepID=A0ABN9PXU7_9DINO|nr:unnamed protein product [Polarella glacialis]
MGKHGWHDLSRCRRWGQTKRTDQTTRSDRNGAATGQAEWSDRTVERRKLRRAAKGNRAFPRFSFRRKLSSMPRQPCQLSVQNERGSTPRPGLPSQALTRSSRSRRGSFRGPSQQTRSQSCRAARRAGWGEGGGRGRGEADKEEEPHSRLRAAEQNGSSQPLTEFEPVPSRPTPRTCGARGARQPRSGGWTRGVRHEGGSRVRRRRRRRRRRREGAPRSEPVADRPARKDGAREARRPRSGGRARDTRQGGAGRRLCSRTQARGASFESRRPCAGQNEYRGAKGGGGVGGRRDTEPWNRCSLLTGRCGTSGSGPAAAASWALGTGSARRLQIGPACRSPGRCLS